MSNRGTKLSGPAPLRMFFASVGRIAPALAARLAVRTFYTPRQFPQALWERAGLARATKSELRWRGGTLPVYQWGDEAGPTVLLVHGWEGRASQLYRIGEGLVARGYRVIAFDGPAHGLSAKQARTTLVEFAEAVSSAFVQFGPVHGVVGHSFGAAAVCIALQNGARAQALALVSCPFSIRNVVSRFASFVGIPGAVHERMYPIMKRLHGCPETDLSFTHIGPGVRVPCLMVHDSQDQYVLLEDGQRTSQHITGAKFMQTEGLGHVRVLQDPTVVSRIVEFVDQHAPASDRFDTSSPRAHLSARVQQLAAK